GVDRRGNLIYAAANDQTVITLARILQRAGAVRGMQFDINPEWPSLIAYRHRGGLDPTKVVPNVMQPATRYLARDDRDFFAVYRTVDGCHGRWRPSFDARRRLAGTRSSSSHTGSRSRRRPTITSWMHGRKLATSSPRRCSHSQLRTRQAAPTRPISSTSRAT